MFAPRQFPNRYFAPRFWPDNGGTIAIVTQGLEFTARNRHAYFEAAQRRMHFASQPRRVHFAATEDDG